MTDAEKVLYWIKLSDRDFKTAKYLAKGGHNFHAGYFCHQAKPNSANDDENCNAKYCN